MHTTENVYHSIKQCYNKNIEVQVLADQLLLEQRDRHDIKAVT